MINKYRKKPVVVEAIQFTDNGQEIVDWIVINGGESEDLTIDFPLIEIKTFEGTTCATYKDYVIKGTKGEFYPCKPDIFESVYEKVEND